MELNEIKEKMGHKFISTTINSYINPERRGLNFLEEEKKFNNSGINALKKRIAFNEKNIEESYSDLNQSDDSFNLDDEGEDYFDDDFGIDNNIFYWTGHFYDDADFLEYKNKKIININNNNITEDISIETPNSSKNKEQLYLNKKFYH